MLAEVIRSEKNLAAVAFLKFVTLDEMLHAFFRILL
jgi:hypothetical protein